MKIIGLFFMTLVFGIISMITSKKYKLQGDLNLYFLKFYMGVSLFL